MRSAARAGCLHLLTPTCTLLNSTPAKILDEVPVLPTDSEMYSKHTSVFSKQIHFSLGFCDLACFCGGGGDNYLKFLEGQRVRQVSRVLIWIQKHRNRPRQRTNRLDSDEEFRNCMQSTTAGYSIRGAWCLARLWTRQAPAGIGRPGTVWPNLPSKRFATVL